ncbi:ABC transporter permease [Leucobacter sp. UCMA 4100]|uniref:ABC transporter permease n=1 Tax=Leucobacter sp. UCMA 4100 TaxID=2810534 RepID=UPI0022EA42D8|nr:ABC transporter permease [Leucobacter sp. UCMA 4100]MDA3146832.1 ABC transporter permease [Leucobacter sp. UCMA 4100]
MLSYVGKRLLALLPVLFVVSIVIFSLVHITPGDPAMTILGPEATPDQLAELREQLGLNQPLLSQYFSWVGGILTGDFGDSLFLKKPVLTAIADNIMPTIQLALLAQIITIIVAVPLGTLAAKRRGSLLDNGVQGLTLIGMAVPSFVLGLILVLVFSVGLRLLPVAGYVNIFTDPSEGFRYLLLPAISLGTVQAAFLTRTTRASVLDVLSADYIDAARSRGVSERRLLFRHSLRNAGLPILTVIGLSFGGLVTGAVVTETIFNIPGIGSLLVNSITRRDYAVIQGVVLFTTLIYLTVNLIIDLLYGLVDPRVRLTTSKGAAR